MKTQYTYTAKCEAWRIIGVDRTTRKINAVAEDGTTFAGTMTKCWMGSWEAWEGTWLIRICAGTYICMSDLEFRRKFNKL